MKPLSGSKVSKKYNSSEPDDVPTTDPMTLKGKSEKHTMECGA
jgi:hypothetical protein